MAAYEQIVIILTEFLCLVRRIRSSSGRRRDRRGGPDRRVRPVKVRFEVQFVTLSWFNNEFVSY